MAVSLIDMQWMQASISLRFEEWKESHQNSECSVFWRGPNLHLILLLFTAFMMVLSRGYKLDSHVVSVFTAFFQCRVLWYIENLSVINFREESGMSADQSTWWEKKMLYSYSGNKCIMWCILLSSLTGHSWPHYDVLLPLLRQTRPVTTSYVLWAYLALFQQWWRSVKGNSLKFTCHLQGDELEFEKIWVMSEDACRYLSGSDTACPHRQAVAEWLSLPSKAVLPDEVKM